MLGLGDLTYADGQLSLTVTDRGSEPNGVAQVAVRAFIKGTVKADPRLDGDEPTFPGAFPAPRATEPDRQAVKVVIHHGSDRERTPTGVCAATRRERFTQCPQLGGLHPRATPVPPENVVPAPSEPS